MNQNNYCVIMAGGVGSRFWPLSRTTKPKQFLDILGTGQSLLQQTFDRFCKIIPRENILIVSHQDYKDLIFEQLPGIHPNQVLLEPMRKNTAVCIAYANFKILKQNPDANIIVAPSDHLILREEEFLDVINKGLEFTQNTNALLTIGIKPSRPETGYGYIQVNADSTHGKSPIRKVKTFTEKPNLEMAKIFFESGEFFWNSGIFIWSLNAILRSFDLYMSDLNNQFQDALELLNTEKEADFIGGLYPKSKSISIDYAIMEKADNVYVICADFGWSDLGTWGSLYTHLDKDEANNALTKDNVFAYNTSNCIVKIASDKLAVIQGLDDYIVVDSDGILLICKKEEEQRIKDFVNDVKLKKGDAHI
ncbi:MAG: mannose-1-phosphate guanylyltransferase [Bacteroidota bacterium]|nr:mannose-1-phosphate guanylyltransferase [Bacteroidota bacterium]